MRAYGLAGMSDAKVEKLKDAAAKVLPSAFRTGAEVQNHRQSVIMISVGSKQVDAMLCVMLLLLLT